MRRGSTWKPGGGVLLSKGWVDIKAVVPSRWGRGQRLCLSFSGLATCKHVWQWHAVVQPSVFEHCGGLSSSALHCLGNGFSGSFLSSLKKKPHIASLEDDLIYIMLNVALHYSVLIDKDIMSFKPQVLKVNKWIMIWLSGYWLRWIMLEKCAAPSRHRLLCQRERRQTWGWRTVWSPTPMQSASTVREIIKSTGGWCLQQMSLWRTLRCSPCPNDRTHHRSTPEP